MHDSVRSLSQPTRFHTGPRHQPLVSLLLACVLLLAVHGMSRAAVIPVNSTANAGAGSLRDAITASNTSAGTFDTITFNIGGGGVQTISLSASLPVITDPVNIDGTSQPGFAGTPLIVLKPAAGFFGDCMTITANNSVVKGLVIIGFGGDGITITGQSAFNNQIQGCYVGVDTTGAAVLGNSDGINIANLAHHNLIGGLGQGSRNVISGNTINGIRIRDTGTNTNTVAGNFIGTNAAGTADLGNNNNGIIVDQATNNTIGGTSAGARNLISGNNNVGLFLNDPDCANNLVQGNYIGTNIAGNGAIANGTGVQIGGFAHNNTVGGTTPSARNLISGNATGVAVLGSGANNNTVSGNYIGTNASGTGALANTGYGVSIDGPTGTIIGGTAGGSGNVISGNGAGGVQIFNNGTTGNAVQGNFIGTNYSGNNPVPNFGNGVTIEAGAGGNIVGGGGVGAGNLISGNAFHGVQIWNPGTDNNKVLGNRIGTNGGGISAIPNGQNGVFIDDAAAGNQIGGTAAGEGNRIAYNKVNGVAIINFAKSNPVRGNAIFKNLKLGIDLELDGVSANDSLDPDSGANDIQNYPAVTTVSVSGGNTTIGGTLNSTPNTNFLIDIYRSVTPDPSGFGEGEIYVGTVNGTTDASGNLTAPFSLTIPGSFATQYFSATATDPANSTSEFSRTFYSITGRITTPAFAGIGGITVVRNGGFGVVTNGAGYFTFAQVPVGTYIIKPTTPTYIYSPTTRTVILSTADVVGQNFIAYPAGAYSIAGRVADAASVGIANVVIKTTGRPDVLTNGAGYYTVPSLPDGNYTVKPVLAGYGFNPVSRNVVISGASVSGQNFVASTGFAVSGRVKDSGGVGIGGVSVKLDAAGPTVTTNSAGYFTIFNVPNGAHSLTPSKAGMTFTPATRNFTMAGANISGQDFVGS